MIAGIEKKIKAKMQMGRDNNYKWHLTIEDETSGLRIIQVEFDDKALSNLLATMYTPACDAEFYLNDNIGKKLKTISVEVALDGIESKVFESYTTRDKEMALVVAKAEGEYPGWKADNDKYNHYRHSYQKKTYTLTMRRCE